MNKLWRVWVLGVLCVAMSACSVRRFIPEGEYMVNKVAIEEDKRAPRKERIASGDMETYIRQTPNKRLLGTNFYVWLYGSAKDKNNKWNNWKRRVGEEPVLVDAQLTARSIRNLKVYMDSRGFFSSKAWCRIDTNYRRRRVNLTYKLHQGEPYRISRIEYEFRDEALREIILPDTVHTLLRIGQPFDTKVLNEERDRITNYLTRLGYFNFSVNNIEYEADTLAGNQTVGVKVIVKQFLTGYDDQGQSVMENNAVHQIRRVNIFPDFDPTVARLDDLHLRQLDTVAYQGLNIIYNNRLHIRPLVLRRTVPIYPNSMYNSATVARTYSDLMSLGYFRTARISFQNAENPRAETNMVSYVGPKADTAHVQRVEEQYLTCNILCSPTLKQSFKIDLEGSTTSSFYGLKTTLGYQNRNIFRGAESFDASISLGYEFMKMRETKKKRANEYGVTLGLTFPRFLVPWRMRNLRSAMQPKTKVELAVNVQDRSFYHRTLTSAGLTYMWQNRHYSSFMVRPIDINVVDVSYLDPDFLSNTTNLYLINSYKTQLMAGLSFSFNFNNQMKTGGRNATMIRINGETSGNFIGAVAHLFSSPTRDPGDTYYKMFDIRYSQYYRFDVSLSRKITIGDKFAVAGRLYGGLAMAYGNSKAVPFDRLFYAGGSNSMRGWAPRALGPGSAPITDTQFPTQLGDMKLEANLEFRFPIWSILQGATFFDVGNIWFLKSNPEQYSNDAVFFFRDFYKQLAFNTGLGLRFDIKFAVLRLDWGVQLYNPNMPAGDRWIKKLQWKNTSLNFGVGYPF